MPDVTSPAPTLDTAEVPASFYRGCFFSHCNLASDPGVPRPFASALMSPRGRERHLRSCIPCVCQGSQWLRFIAALSATTPFPKHKTWWDSNIYIAAFFFCVCFVLWRLWNALHCFKLPSGEVWWHLQLPLGPFQLGNCPQVPGREFHWLSKSRGLLFVYIHPPSSLRSKLPGTSAWQLNQTEGALLAPSSEEGHGYHSPCFLASFLPTYLQCEYKMVFY